MFQGNTILPGARVAGVLLAAVASAPLAYGQTVTLRSVKDATIRGGTYASTNFGDDDILETRQSSDGDYLRRAVLTFDTESSISDNASVASAKLTLTSRKATRRSGRCTPAPSPRPSMRAPSTGSAGTPRRTGRTPAATLSRGPARQRP